jgi:hypothetical protein
MSITARFPRWSSCAVGSPSTGCTSSGTCGSRPVCTYRLLGYVRADGSSPAPDGRCEEVNVVVYNKCEPLENMTTRPCVTLVDQSHDTKASRLRNHGSYLDYILEYYGR